MRHKDKNTKVNIMNMPRSKPGMTIIQVSKAVAKRIKDKAITRLETYDEILIRLLDQK